VLLFWLAPGLAFATGCKVYTRVHATLGCGPSPTMEACAAESISKMSAASNYNYALTGEYSEAAGGTWTFGWNRYFSSGVYAGSGSSNGTWAETDCPDCSDMAAESKYFLAPYDYPVGDIPELCLPTAIGEETVQCKFEYYGHVGGSGGGFSMMAPQYNATGEGCLVEAPPEEYQEYPLPENATCWQGTAELLCVDPVPRFGKNCGTVDGEWVCVQSVPTGTCVFVAGGGLACEASAPVQPDIGDGETPATPAAQFKGDSPVEGGSATTVNYYTSSQVSNSQTVVTGSGGGAGPGGDGDGEGEGGGSGTASGDCGTPPACEGDAIQCAILEQSWWSRCEDVLTVGELETLEEGVGMPVVESVDVGALDPGLFGASAATCPAPIEVEVYGQVKQIPYDFFCDLAVMVKPLVMILAYLAGAMIVVPGLRGPT
jgi:hypothetical protein